MELRLRIHTTTACAICNQMLTQSDVDYGRVIAAAVEEQAVFACLGHFYRRQDRRLKRLPGYSISVQALVTAARRVLGAPLTAPVVDAVYRAQE